MDGENPGFICSKTEPWTVGRKGLTGLLQQDVGYFSWLEDHVTRPRSKTAMSSHRFDPL